MSKLRIRPRASEDLIEIWSYFADDSVANADAFIDKFCETLNVAAPSAWLGHQRADLAPELQSFPFARCIIFYCAGADAIEIVRVLHGARDIENIF